MAITFPASPSDGDVFTNSTTGVKYIYNATDGVWKTHVWPTNTDYLQLSGGTLTGDLSLGTNDLTAQDITTTGSVTVGNGLTLSDGDITVAAGHGINFSADANAAGMQGELLDVYERGTWTPTFATRDASNVVHALSGASYLRQSATYVKVGHLVHVRCRVTLSNKGTVTAGQVNVAGLPFTVLTITEGWNAIALGFSSGWVTYAPQACLAVPGGNELQLYANSGADSRADMSGPIIQAYVGNASDVILAGTYRTDD